MCADDEWTVIDVQARVIRMKRKNAMKKEKSVQILARRIYLKKIRRDGSLGSRLRI